MSEFSANTNRVTVALSGKNVQLNSAEGEAFIVPIEIASLSEHIRETIAMSSDEELPVLDFPTLETRTLRAVIAFMHEYTAEPYPKIPHPLPKDGLYSIIQPFYQNFLNLLMIDGGKPDPANPVVIPEGSTTLVLLLIAANTLTIAPLKKLISSKMADMTRGKNINDMFDIFDIERHVPKWEDMERIRKEHAYAFERPQEEEESASASAAAAGNP
jgi:hypothetical protein